MKKLFERREHKRLMVKCGAIVVLNKPKLLKFTKPRQIKLGPIIDISKGGLAVQYIDNKKRLNDCVDLNITLITSTSASDVFEETLVQNIPFKVVSDVEVAKLANSIDVRRRSIQFGDLTGVQKAHLAQFIHSLETEFSPTANTENKDKQTIQLDIMNKFKAIGAKAGSILPPLWVQNAYEPSLNLDEKDLFYETMNEMISEGIIEYVQNPVPNCRLTKKGESWSGHIAPGGKSF
jgi:hypothetical protein